MYRDSRDNFKRKGKWKNREISGSGQRAEEISEEQDKNYTFSNIGAIDATLKMLTKILKETGIELCIVNL